MSQQSYASAELEPRVFALADQLDDLVVTLANCIASVPTNHLAMQKMIVDQALTTWTGDIEPDYKRSRSEVLRFLV